MNRILQKESYIIGSHESNFEIFLETQEAEIGINMSDSISRHFV